MSILDRSLALEEIKVAEDPLIDLLPLRHLSISNTTTDPQLTCQTVKISGSITVSF